MECFFGECCVDVWVMVRFGYLLMPSGSTYWIGPVSAGAAHEKFDRDTPPIPNHTWRLATGDLSNIV